MEAIQPCIIANGEFNVVQNQGASCTICGRYLVQTSTEADYFLQAEQRCTFVWELISDTPKIRHMHISNPMGELKIADGSRFVNEIGQMAKKYLEEKIQDLTGSQIVVPRRDGGTIFLLLRDILYAEARLRYCEVSLENGEQITLNMSLTEFAKLTDDYFVKVHRSYLVNIRHVSTICPYEITMQNGLRIPVPQKKYTAVRQMLMKRHVPGDHQPTLHSAGTRKAVQTLRRILFPASPARLFFCSLFFQKRLINVPFTHSAVFCHLFHGLFPVHSLCQVLLHMFFNADGFPGLLLL